MFRYPRGAKRGRFIYLATDPKRLSPYRVLLHATVHPGPLPCGEAPQRNETGGGGFVEGAVRVVGGELLAVERLRSSTSGDGTGALVQLEPHRAGYGLLGLPNKSVEGAFEGREPEAVVGKFGVALLDGCLEAQDVLGKGHRLELPMGLDHSQGGGALVDLAALDADEPVFDHVYPPDPVRPGNLIELRDKLHERQLLAVESGGQSLLEVQGNVLGIVRGLLGGGGEGENVLGRLVVRVLQRTSLDGAAKEVLVDAVGGLLGDGNGDAVLLGVGYLLGAAHVPVAHRGYYRK